jgi:hypothetical protein
MSNCFRGGKFDKLRLLSMEDELPFEHELFQIISQDFPSLRQLIMRNDKPQTKKHHDSSTLITFNHLFKLDLFGVHRDYVIQFLSDKDTTRLNCSKIKSLITYKLFVGSRNFHSYFPSL